MGEQVHGPAGFNDEDALQIVHRQLQMYVPSGFSEQLRSLIEPDYAGWTDKLPGEQHPAHDGYYRARNIPRCSERY